MVIRSGGGAGIEKIPGKIQNNWGQGFDSAYVLRFMGDRESTMWLTDLPVQVVRRFGMEIRESIMWLFDLPVQDDSASRFENQSRG
jgi:hypothetical protein